MVRINTLIGFEDVKDYYFITEEGKVIGNKGLIRKTFINKNGYERISLKTKNGYKKASLHRLVALAFIPNPNNLPEVNHKDENKTHNWKDNLEWCDRKYNHKYGNAKLKRSLSKSKGRCYLYDYKLNFLGEFISYNTALKYIGYGGKKGRENFKCGDYFLLSKKDPKLILKIDFHNRKPYIVINTKNQEKLIFPSKKEAAEYLECSPSNFRNEVIKNLYKVCELDYNKYVKGDDI